MSISRSSAGSWTAAAGGPTVAVQRKTAAPAVFATAPPDTERTRRGARYLHHAVDDRSRVAYSEILDNERKETASAF